jgi:hypothetical protein
LNRVAAAYVETGEPERRSSAILLARPRTTTMKASEVRILPALDPGESYVEPTFVLVETAPDDSGEPVTTIEHVASRVVGDKVRWQIARLGQSVALTHGSALEWAVSFAASRNVPIVYQRDEASPRYAATPNAQPESAASVSK